MDRISLPTFGTLMISLILPILLICTVTYLKTLYRFHVSIRKLSNRRGEPVTFQSPPLIPYAIPGLGSTLSFSNQTVGSFWGYLRKQASRYHQDAFSVVIAGKLTHFIFSPSGVASVFKSRHLTRASLDRQLGVNALGMSTLDSFIAFPDNPAENSSVTTERLHSEHLLSSAAVNLLTTKFMETFTTHLDAEDGLDDGIQVNLYEWLWPRIFRASTTALVGETLLDMYPDFEHDYRTWEDNLLALLFGTPRFFARHAYRARDACVEKLSNWLLAISHRRATNEKSDTHDPDWTPEEGARIMRKRHVLYAERRLSVHAQAGWDLVFLAGIVSNATPAAGWLLLHILSPTSAPEFRPRIMEEVQACQRADGSLDVSALTRAPRLNAAFHEVLRLYVDLIVVREVGSSGAVGVHKVGRGDQVMAPTWMTHRDPKLFEDPDTFNPDRFLTMDEETGEIGYSATGRTGAYFPFGGGHYMCPGRVFAKQEVLGTVAWLLLNFQIDFVEFVKKEKGNWKMAGVNEFPGIKKGFAGGQVVGIEGDMRVHIKRRGSKLS